MCHRDLVASELLKAEPALRATIVNLHKAVDADRLSRAESEVLEVIRRSDALQNQDLARKTGLVSSTVHEPVERLVRTRVPAAGGVRRTPGCR